MLRNMTEKRRCRNGRFRKRNESFRAAGRSRVRWAPGPGALVRTLHGAPAGLKGPPVEVPVVQTGADIRTAKLSGHGRRLRGRGVRSRAHVSPACRPARR
ncbi:hypothetical protein GCM10010104_50120 [Streptomyces indiaensis]|uniref:Uncharacterized protein n=1 Tax=Streptomyces indiaensis TaxID=284033 RepID=A0ABN3E429_9ACTN